MREPLLTLEEWTNSKSIHDIVVPEIGASFFTGGRPTTHNPDGGLSTIDPRYTNVPQRYLRGMTNPDNRDKVRFSLMAHYIDLVSNKNASGDSIDHDYMRTMP